MPSPLLPAEQRTRFAQAAGALLAMPSLFTTVETEVETTLEEHPELPRTERTRRVLWALALKHLSQTAAAFATASTQTQNEAA